MKIMHICLSGAVTDGFSYQDNLLSKYHKKIGLDVVFIASKWIYDKNGCILPSSQFDYINNDGVRMIRLDNWKNEKYEQKFKHFIGLTKILQQENPDIIFIHGVQFLEMNEIVKYVKKNKTKVYVDNHADFSNSATNWISKNILHKLIWKHQAQIIAPYVAKFYGVLPARVDFLIDVYGLPKEKCELLIMGADDEAVKKAADIKIRNEIRTKFNIETDDFLIITGGKIDAWKTQILFLMDAVKRISNPKVKLIVFGSVEDELKEKVNILCDGNKVQYIGWVQSSDSYKYFASADLVVFPGRHSVFWEQVVAQGIPMVCKYWEGTTHVDVGGNVAYIYKDSLVEVQMKIEELINNQEMYYKMKSAANEKRKEFFLYSRIARQSIGIREDI